MMRNVSIAGVVAAVVVGIWIGVPNSSERSNPKTSPKAAFETDTQSTSGTSRRRPTLNPEATPLRQAADTEKSGLRKRLGVRLSGREQREGERDDYYERRLIWLDKFASFEARADLSDVQKVRLLSLLADKQEEAVLSWEESTRAAREATLEDIERSIADPTFEAFPSILSLEKALQRDLWVELRSFLTPKQIVSFRRTSRLNSVMGYAHWLPLEIKTAPVEE